MSKDSPDKNNYFLSVKENFHLILSFLCIIVWGFLYLYIVDFTLGREFDFGVYYEGGKQILKNPEKLYNVPGYAYLPARACLYSISFSLLPLTIAAYIHYILVFVFGFLYIREFDRVIKLMGMNEKVHRFALLLIISNGIFVFFEFNYNQEKFLIGFLLFFILKREIIFRDEEKKKDLRFYLIHYGIIAYVIAMAPYLMLFLPVYVLHDVKFNEIFAKNNLKKYGICLGMLLCQNFLFIIYPNLIFDFLLSQNTIQYAGDLSFVIIYIIIISVLPLILIIKKDLKIEVKFGWFFFAWIFLGTWGVLPVLTFPLSFLTFIPFLDVEDKTLKGFIFNNKLISIGLFVVIVYFFIPRDYMLFYFFPAAIEYWEVIKFIQAHIIVYVYGVFVIAFILQRKGFLSK